MMKSGLKCQIEGCYRLAEYCIFRIRLDGRKEWLYVCSRHEAEIGDCNMRRASRENNKEVTNER